jgi:hypothetical protein
MPYRPSGAARIIDRRMFVRQPPSPLSFWDTCQWSVQLPSQVLLIEMRG